MDFTDILPILIFLAIYIIVGRKNKKNRNQTKAQAGATAPSRPAAGGGLQERLEEALRQMQERVEQETGGRSSAAGQNRSQLSSSAPAQISTAEALSAQTTPFEPVTFESSSGNSPFEFAAPTPLHQRKTVLDAFRKDAPAKKSREGRREEEIGVFHEGHGLHSRIQDSTNVPEFHEAHGLHHDNAAFRWGEKGKQMSDASQNPLFRNPEELRRAIIAAEILGPPKGAGRS